MEGVCRHKSRGGISICFALPHITSLRQNVFEQVNKRLQQHSGRCWSEIQSGDTAGSDYHPDNNTATVSIVFNREYTPYKETDGDMKMSNYPAFIHFDGTPTANSNLCSKESAAAAAQTLRKIEEAFRQEVVGWVYHHPNGPDPENADIETQLRLQAGWDECRQRVELYLQSKIGEHNDYDSEHGHEFPLVLGKSKIAGLESLSMSKIRRASNARTFVDNTIFARLTYQGDPDHGKTFSPFDGEASEEFGITIYGTRRGKERLGGKDGVPMANAIRSLDDGIAVELMCRPYKFDPNNSPGENWSIINDSMEGTFHSGLENYHRTKEASNFPLTAVKGRDLKRLADAGYKVEALERFVDYNGHGRNPCRGGRNPF